MGAWSSDFIGNDSFQDELALWQESSAENKVKRFNFVLKNALKESKTFLILEDEPIDPIPGKDYSVPIVNPEQELEFRELFLGYIQHFLSENTTQLLSKSVLEKALFFLRQFGHDDIMTMQGWVDIPERFVEIYKLQFKVKELLSIFNKS